MEEYSVSRWETPISDKYDSVYYESLVQIDVPKGKKDAHLLYYVRDNGNIIYEFEFESPWVFVHNFGELRWPKIPLTVPYIEYGKTMIVVNSELLNIIHRPTLPRYLSIFDEQTRKRNLKYTCYFIGTVDSSLEVLTNKEPVITTYSLEEYNTKCLKRINDHLSATTAH